MKKSPQIGPWTLNRSSTIIKDSWIDLRADDCTMPSGVSISPYYILSYPDWAHTVCLDQDDRICVVWQYRHGAARVMMELPGGVVEAGEDPLEAARRELPEGTGLRGRQWRARCTLCRHTPTHTQQRNSFLLQVPAPVTPPRPAAAESSTV